MDMWELAWLGIVVLVRLLQFAGIILGGCLIAESMRK